MSTNGSSPVLLEAVDLVKHFAARTSAVKRKSSEVVHAVDGVSLEVRRGETLGIVGESGCGKSTLGRLLVRLLEPTSGTLRFGGEDITTLSQRELRPFRRELQMVFQDPYASLNPRRRVGEIVADPLEIHGVGNGEEIRRRVLALLDVVGLSPHHVNRFPHEFSGGQRQRIGVARALALNPQLIVADEPVSALDVSIQAQVINLLDDLQDEFHLTYVFIAHDLGVIHHVSDRIAVMYLGVIVETAPADDLYARPIHPYTEALLSAIPDIDTGEEETPREQIVLEGEVPSPIAPPSGCRFHTRCPYATEICSEVRPPLADFGDGRYAACHHPLGGAVPVRARERERERRRNELQLGRTRDLVPGRRSGGRRLVEDAGVDLPRRPGRGSRLRRADRRPEPVRARLCALRPARLREERAPAGRARRVLDAAALQGRARRARRGTSGSTSGTRSSASRGVACSRWSTPSIGRRGCARSSSPIRRRACGCGCRRRTGCAATYRRTCRRR